MEEMFPDDRGKYPAIKVCWQDVSCLHTVGPT